MIMSFDDAYEQLKKDYAAACMQRDNLLRENNELGARVQGYQKRSKLLIAKVEALKAELAESQALLKEAQTAVHHLANEASGLRETVSNYADARSEPVTVTVDLTLKHGKVCGVGFSQ